jgi:hypothetical protein
MKVASSGTPETHSRRNSFNSSFALLLFHLTASDNFSGYPYPFLDKDNGQPLFSRSRRDVGRSIVFPAAPQTITTTSAALAYHKLIIMFA